MRQLFSGTGVALVTPFRNGKIDFPALEKLIEHCLHGGVDFLVSLGTTGEAATLSSEECRKVFDFTVKTIHGRVPLVAGKFGGNDTSTLSEKIKEFDFDGIDAIMSSSPAYNKPTQEGIFQHFMALESVSPLPIIIYNVPGRTASNVAAETTLRLANASSKFIAVKEASGNLGQIMQIIKKKPEQFLVLSGDDVLTLPIISCGGHGVISVIANAFPNHFSNMVKAALAGDFSTAQRLNLELLDIHPLLYLDGNPAGIKGALEIMGFCRKEVRLPLVPISDINYKALKEELEKAGAVGV